MTTSKPTHRGQSRGWLPALAGLLLLTTACAGPAPAPAPAPAPPSVGGSGGVAADASPAPIVFRDTGSPQALDPGAPNSETEAVPDADRAGAADESDAA